MPVHWMAERQEDRRRERDRKTGEEKKLLIISLMVQAGDSSGVCYLGQVP